MSVYTTHCSGLRAYLRKHAKALLGQRPSLLIHVRVRVSLGHDTRCQSCDYTRELQRLRKLVRNVGEEEHQRHLQLGVRVGRPCGCTAHEERAEDARQSAQQERDTERPQDHDQQHQHIASGHRLLFDDRSRRIAIENYRNCIV